VSTSSRAATSSSRAAYAGPYASLVNASARANGLDPWLLAGLIGHESNFDPNAVSATGDVGVVQINLASHPTVTRAQALNPSFAIPWAARYLAALKVHAGGSTVGALRAYNTGSSASSRAGDTYAAAVLGERSSLLARTEGVALASLSAFLSYPLGVLGSIIGRPYQGTHKPGATTPANWQSDNAVDVAVPVGTPVYAVAGGTIGPNVGAFSSSSPYLAGQRLTLETPGNAFYYAHLSKLAVRAGEKVNPGQLLGYSGAANGVAHLHFAQRTGDPVSTLAGLTSSGAAPGSGAVNVQNASLVGSITGAVGDAAGAVGGAISGAAGAVGGAITGAGGDVAGALAGPFKEAVAPFVAIGTAAERFVKDPAYPFLWLGAMLLGGALIFVGVERLLGRSAATDAKGAASSLPVAGPAAGAAGGGAGLAAVEEAPLAIAAV
jgi:murein DD-endopeptidase MepM/ murein hydrolase activator NlpD